MLDHRIDKGTADSGEDIYIFYNNDKRKIPLNSMYSPQKEAERFTSNFSLKGKVIFLVGIGNGALVEYWIKSFNEFIHLFIIEPYEGIVLDNRMQKIKDENKNISFLYYKDFSAIKFSSVITRYQGVDMELIIHPNYEKTNAKYMGEVVSELRKGISMFYINRNTGDYFKKDWVIEPLNNLKYTYNNTSIEELKNKYTGERAVLVASGPSLIEHINTVKKLQESSYVFAAGSAVNGLINNGVMPDFVTVFDSSDRNYEAHFKDSIYTGPLIVGSLVNSKILEHHKGDIIVAVQAIDNITRRVRPEMEEFPITPSVALLTLRVINYLGFDEVYLVGQDLALVNDRYYSQGVNEHEGSKNIKTDFYIESNSGDKVGTTHSLYVFLQSLEDIIQSIGEDTITIYNLSKNGAKIKGTTYIEITDINTSKKRKQIELDVRPRIITDESKDMTGRILDEFIEAYKEAKRIKMMLSSISIKKKLNNKSIEKIIKAIKRLRSHSITEDVITKRLAFQVTKINNIIDYSIKDDDTNTERVLLVKELQKIVDLVYLFMTDLFNDERYKTLLKENSIKNKESYIKYYEDN